MNNLREIRELNILCNAKGYEEIEKKLDDIFNDIENTHISLDIASLEDGNCHIKLTNFERDYSEYLLEENGAFDDEDNSIQKLILKLDKLINDDDDDIAIYVAYIGEDLIDLEEDCTTLANKIFPNAGIVRNFNI